MFVAGRLCKLEIKADPIRCPEELDFTDNLEYLLSPTYSLFTIFKKGCNPLYDNRMDVELRQLLQKELVR